MPSCTDNVCNLGPCRFSLSMSWLAVLCRVADGMKWSGCTATWHCCFKMGGHSMLISFLPVFRVSPFCKDRFKRCNRIRISCDVFFLGLAPSQVSSIRVLRLRGCGFPVLCTFFPNSIFARTCEDYAREAEWSLPRLRRCGPLSLISTGLQLQNGLMQHDISPSDLLLDSVYFVKHFEINSTD